MNTEKRYSPEVRARQQLHTEHIVAITTQQNAASIRVLEKLGFSFEAEIAIPRCNKPSRPFVNDV